MVQTRMMGRWLSAALLACSAEADPPAEGTFRTHEEENAPPAAFVVHVDEEATPTSSAQLTLSFHSDGTNDVDLSFESNADGASTSVVMKPSLEQLSARDFSLAVTRDALTTGHANVLIEGQPMARGQLQVDVESDGTLRGTSSGLERQLGFAGKIVLHCMVPASEASHAASLPVPVSDSAGEVLWLDAEFTTGTCQAAGRALGFRQ